MVIDISGKNKSKYWKRGFAHGCLGRELNHPKLVGSPCYRRANREYNFGFGAGEQNRGKLERLLKKWMEVSS